MNPEASVGLVQARAAAAGKQLDTTLMESRCRFKMIDYFLLPCSLCSSNTALPQTQTTREPCVKRSN